MSQKFNVLQIHVDIAKILIWDIVISEIETFEVPVNGPKWDTVNVEIFAQYIFSRRALDAENLM